MSNISDTSNIPGASSQGHWNPAFRPHVAGIEQPGSAPETLEELPALEVEESTTEAHVPHAESDEGFLSRQSGATADDITSPVNLGNEQSQPTQAETTGSTDDTSGAGIQDGQYHSNSTETFEEQPIAHPSEDNSIHPSVAQEPGFEVEETSTFAGQRTADRSDHLESLPEQDEPTDADMQEEASQAAAQPVEAYMGTEVQDGSPHQNTETIPKTYEHQGEVTEADSAVGEAVTASLLQDEEIMPTPGWDTISEAPYFATSQAEPPVVSQPEARDASQNEQASTHRPAASFDWGPADADAEFDKAFLSAEKQPVDFEDEQKAVEHAFDITGDTGAKDSIGEFQTDLSDDRSKELQAEAESNDSAFPEAGGDFLAGEGQTDEEIAALWAAALEEDDFLDNKDVVDPSGFFVDDDDDGFLADFAASQSAGQTAPDALSSAPGQSVNRYLPDAASQPQPQGHFSMSSPQFFDQTSNPRPASTPSSEFYGGFGQSQFGASAATKQRPAPPSSTKSFVDQAKSGYASPYDLPMDIVKPRKRPSQLSAATSAQSLPPPPPRSSSMNNALPAMGSPSIHQPSQVAASITSLSPPSSSHSNQSFAQRNTVPPSTTSARDQSGFFADLPMVSKARARPSGTFTPGPATGQSPPMSGPPLGPTAPPIACMMPPALGGLRQPDRLPLLPEIPTESQQPVSAHPPTTVTPSRYSPAAHPAPSSNARFSPMPPSVPAVTSRYSPAPASQGPTPQPSKYTSASGGPGPAPVPGLNRYATTTGVPSAVTKPYANISRTSSPLAQPNAPRTSSPLAQFESTRESPKPTVVSTPSYQPNQSTYFTQSPERHALATETYSTEDGQRSNSMPTERPSQITSPPQYNASVSSQMPPPSRTFSGSKYAPLQQQMTDSHATPQRRPRTQSPGAVMKGPRVGQQQVERPTSALGTAVPSAFQTMQYGQPVSLPHRRTFSTDLSYAIPQDERAADPLQRFKGYPIFRWGTSGTLVSSFPKQAPFYAAGHAIPVITCTAGSITIHDVKQTLPMNPREAKFPGPLSGKSKGKKKDVMSWLSGKIEYLERMLEGTLLDIDVPPALKRREEEKVILWKMVKLVLEHDNAMDGKTGIDEAVRQILVPSAAQRRLSESTNGVDAAAGLQPEPAVPQAFVEIKKHLLAGHREKAVWYAAEQRLWSHALLISSTTGPELYKQVVQEFVKSQLKDAGENAQSLAALYEVFAGNWEESVDELVPPSARAGFQMVSKMDSVGASSKNPLDGLDQWRETLCLILSNRSTNDGQAIAALGRLLAGYGRIEAAHVCFLFARAFVSHSSAEDPDANFVLLGADHKSASSSLGHNLDAILLTEIYEYAMSLTPVPGSSHVIPHLQAYKLMHAYQLAEHGLKGEAQAYCDAIVTAVKSSTRSSPYYHVAFTSAVEELSRCLSQSPQTGSSSAWISRISSDKVSNKLFNRFTSFVAGDDSDQASTGSGPAGVAGPFGKVAGDTPSVSRSASHTDLYSAMSVNLNSAVTTPAIGATPPSKYTPGTPQSTSSRYAPQASSTYAPGGRVSLDSARSYEPERPSTGHGNYSSITSKPAGLQRIASYSAFNPQVQPLQQGKSLQNLAVPRPEVPRTVSDYIVPYSQSSSRRESVQDGPSSVASYEPRPSMEQEPAGSPYGSHSGHGLQFSDHGLKINDRGLHIEGASRNGYTPLPAADEDLPDPEGGSQGRFSYEPPTASYEPPSSTFEPPMSTFEASPAQHSSIDSPSKDEDTGASGYEPPSYAPYEPDYEGGAADRDSPEPAKKKKSFMDDDEDDDFAAKAAALKAKAKAQADKDADDAFRKAAEADAERDKAKDDAAARKGWLSGWFGKKDPNAPEVHRAKLGEQSSFYYDAELKKWVNKKGGTPTESPAATPPPPPRGPPSRVVSNTGLPPSGPPSRIASGVGLAGLGQGPPVSRPGTAGGPPAGPSSVGSGPPSRIGTPSVDSPAISQGSAPPSLNGMEAPPSRPATSMSMASSIDDLLGVPQARKGGTVKGKKRGGRYVDVMAK